MVIEKLKKVLEALEYIMLERSLDSATTIARNARYFLREAIEEADSQIVAWMFQHSETGRITFVEHHQIENGWEKGNPRYNKIGPLYTTPQQRTWVGLTLPDREKLRDQFEDWNYPASLVSAIEAKLKEKNT